LDAWEATIAELGDEGLERPGACGEWRVRDVLAHITGWDRWQVVQLSGAFTKQEPTVADISGPVSYGHEMDKVVTPDQRNAVFYATHKNRPLELVLAEWRDVSAMQLDWVAGASQQQIDEPVGVLFGPRLQALFLVGETPEASNAKPAGEWITEQTDHRREHLDEVRAWMSR
jgi:hypothetical protein